MAEKTTFEQFRRTLTDLGRTGVVPDEVRQLIESAAAGLAALPRVDRESLAALVRERPDWVPVLGAAVGLSHEALKNQLRARMGTAGWIQVALRDSLRLVAALDEGFDLVEQIKAQRERDWTFADILVERYGARTRAAGSIVRGRALEDEIEAIATGLDLPHEMRTRFMGRGGREVPCDIAIPAGGDRALIVGFAKGFNSTGSKLTDAVREVEQMASVRLPRQFVFAFVDGIGWLGRDRDLRRIYDLWATDEIDGLYSLARMDEFRQDLRTAALRLGLLTSGE
jgi:hypothetical protein